MTYSQIDALLRGVCSDTFHLAAPDDVTRFVVWGETGNGVVFAGGKRIPVSNKFSVYIYTQEESDTLTQDIIAALEASDVCISGPSPGWDDERMTLVSVLECEAI